MPSSHPPTTPTTPTAASNRAPKEAANPSAAPDAPRGVRGGATVVLAGHCGPDAWALRAALGSMIPGSTIVAANDDAALRAAAAEADLVLVNRALDGRFAAADGIELIRQLRQETAPASPPVMLVSNYPDAQARAEAAGAAPGFGKTALYSPQTRARILDALARQP